MKALKTILKIEGRLAIRSGDSIFFGVFFPVGVVLLLGIIYGMKAAFEGSGYSFMQQNFGAVVSFGICATGLMGLPLVLADYRDKKILKQYKVTPVSPGLLLFIQIVIAFAISVISGIAVYAVSALLFGYRMLGSFGLFILAYILVTLAIYGLGMLIASLCPNIKTANLVCTIIYFPMVFLSGATVPYEIMPKAMQKVVDFLPLTQGIKLLKGISLGFDIQGVSFPIILLMGIALVSTIISIKYFKWE